MLDEQTPAETGTAPDSAPATAPATGPTDSTASEPPAKPARKRAPRKTAAKKAAAPEPASAAGSEPGSEPGPEPAPAAGSEAPAEPGAAETAETAEAAPARKRSPRKAATKTAAKTTKAAAKTTAKRATKKAAPPPDASATPDDAAPAPVDAVADAPAGTAADAPAGAAPAEEKPARPARKTAKRASKKAAAAPAAPSAGEAGAETQAEAPVAAATSAVEQPPAVADQTDRADRADQPDDGGSEAGAGRATPAVTPLFQPPDPTAARPTRKRATKKAGPPKPAAEAAGEAAAADQPAATTRGRPADETAVAVPAVEGEDESAATATTAESPDAATAATAGEAAEAATEEAADEDTDEGEGGGRRRRRRGGRRRRKPSGDGGDGAETADDAAVAASAEPTTGPAEDKQQDSEGEGEGGGSSRRRRRRRRSGDGDDDASDDSETTVTKVRKPRNAEDEITGFTGSTRLEAKKQRRREGREAGRRRAPIISEAEFLARRESVDRKMVIRQRGDLTQIAVLEDKVLVEHYVARESQTSLIGNVYLGRVQNVLPSMEAAFIDIGKGRNAVLYAGEVNWDALGAKDGKQRKIEQVLKSGQSVLVQVTKDPIGHKGARLTSQVSLPGRFLVYVPDGTTSGISRKLPDNERNRLKSLLKEIVPDTAGVIVRTAAEGASESELTRDVERLKALWEDIESKVEKGNAPQLLYGEPDLTLKVVRDLFTEDIGKLVVSGDDAWEMVSQYVDHVAPDLAERLERHDDSEADAFAEYRIDEQIAKGLDRKVWLPSGGSLVIDRTEAMTVVDVNTGKFTGSGGNLEETVTKNNLEAAEEIVRQLRLRDIGGIIVVDFIDMVLESNRDLVLRRLIECLGRDRTRHQVAEVTSLGLVQMTRKRIGTGLLEAFSESCEACAGRGLIVHQEPVEQRKRPAQADDDSRRGRRGRGRKGDDQGDEARDSKGSGGRNGRSGRDGKDGRDGRDGRDGKDGRTGDGHPVGGKRPTPAEFAAMVRSEPAESTEAVEAAGAVEAVAPAEAVESVEPVTQAVTAAETVVPDEAPAEARPAPAPETAAQGTPPGTQPETADAVPAPEPVAAPVSTGPRVVTRVRRVGARRAAGPPAPVEPPLAPVAPVEERTVGDAVDGAPTTLGGEHADQAVPDQAVHDEAVHVPVKKKGSRKR